MFFFFFLFLGVNFSFPSEPAPLYAHARAVVYGLHFSSISFSAVFDRLFVRLLSYSEPCYILPESNHYNFLVLRQLSQAVETSPSLSDTDTVES